MGLISGLLTLPLAPVRGTMWLAKALEAEAMDQLNDESSIMGALMELEAARDTGEYSENEIEESENALVERLIALRGTGGQELHGELE
jgi:Gas vesicle protein G